VRTTALVPTILSTKNNIWTSWLKVSAKQNGSENFG